jgi:ribosome biogenesis GTPase
MTGLVVKNTGSWYMVRVDDGPTSDASTAPSQEGAAAAEGGPLLPCKVKGNFRLKGIRTTNPVAVGDRVTVEPNTDGTAFITQIMPRRNYIIRKASNLSKQAHILAANVDEMLLIVTVAHPQTSTTFIDRVLATAEAYSVPTVLVINKVDLYTPEEQHYADGLQYLYETIGYEVLQISTLTGQGIDALRQRLRDKVTLLSGHSGVGKSTLINTLLPHLDTKLRTGEISDAHDMGMHTTTFSEMFSLPDGGYLIDTPGVKGFGTVDFAREEAGHYFREIFRASANCRFNNCTHIHEPGCAVLQAVEEHRISQSRYASYLSILDDAEEGKYRENT